MKTKLLNSRIQTGFLVFALLVLLISACQKRQDELIIQGTVISMNEDQALGGVSVELYTRKVESGIYTANYDFFGSIVTNSSGEFTFNLPREAWASIQLMFAKEGYFNWDYTIEGDVLKSDEGFNESFSMNPKSWLHFRIVNEDPQTSGDTFEYRLLNATTVCEICCTDSRQNFSGMTVNEENVCQIIGHQEVLVQWSSTKNSLNTGGTNTYFVPAGDTTIIEFNY